MAASWINEISAELIEDGKEYFIAIKPVTKMVRHLFLATDKNGNARWSQKPGIANSYVGSESMRQEMAAREDLIAVEVPKNAGKKWRARS